LSASTQVIVELNVANNGIDEFGCFTLLAGLRENTSLRNIVLDGNPLGVQVRVLAVLAVLWSLFSFSDI
jgi:hypothetical protein